MFRLRNICFILCGIAVLTFLVYLPGLHAPFILDDYASIVHQIKLHYLSGLGDLLSLPELATRPLLNISFWINYKIHGLSVFGYHLTNLVLHILNSFLLFSVLTIFFKNRIYSVSILTLCFAIHPVHSEAVLYITQRSELLLFFFILLSFRLYLVYRTTQNKFMLICALLTAFCSHLSKESSLILPFLIYSYDYFYLSEKRIQPRHLLFLIVSLTVPALFLFVSVNPHEYSWGSIGVSGWAFMWTQFKVILFYIGLMLWPTRLNLEYDFPLSQSFLDVSTLVAFGCIIAILLAAWCYRKKERLFSFAVCWFFLTLAYRNSIIPNKDFVVDYALYLPSVGFFMVMGLAFSHLEKKKKIFTNVSVGGFALWLCVLTSQRAALYADGIKIWKDTLAKSPHKTMARNNLAYMYELKGMSNEAKEEFEYLVKHHPNNVTAKTNLARYYLKEGKTQEALKLYKDVLALTPKDSKAFQMLAYFYLKNNFLEQAWQVCQKWAQVVPDDEEVYFIEGMILSRQFNTKKAIHAFQKALTLNQKSVPIRYYLSKLLVKEKRFNEALKIIEEAKKVASKDQKILALYEKIKMQSNPQY